MSFFTHRDGDRRVAPPLVLRPGCLTAACALVAVLPAGVALAGLEVTSLGKLSPGLSSHDEDNGTSAKWAKVQADLGLDPSRVVARQASVDLGGNTSVRNEWPLQWKTEDGYYQRNRDLGQVFTAPAGGFTLDYIVLRTGNGSSAFLPGTGGAPVFIEFFEVTGEPVINNNGTRYDQNPTHGFGVGANMGRADDFLEGVTYTPIKVVRNATVPDLRASGDGKLTYMKWDLTGSDQLTFDSGKRYAFMVGLEMPGQQVGFTLGNQNNAAARQPESLTDGNDTYHGGWSIRREGDGTIPPDIYRVNGQPSSTPPSDPALRAFYQNQSLFPAGDGRYALSPTTDGYPDVDTYRDLEFYMVALDDAPPPPPPPPLPTSLSVSASGAAPASFVSADSLPFGSTDGLSGTSIRHSTTSGSNNIDRGQTFTPGHDYVLDRITVQIQQAAPGAAGAPISLELWANQVGGWTRLTTFTDAQLPQLLSEGDFLTFDIGNINVAAGTEYGFVLLFDDAGADRELDLARYGDVYPGGSGWTRLFAGDNARPSPAVAPSLNADRDMVFYLTAVPEPSALWLGLPALLALRRARR